MIFSSLPFHGIPLDAAADRSLTLLSRCPPLTAYPPTTPHISIPSIESHHISLVVVSWVCHPRSCSTSFCCSPFSSFSFSRLRRRHSSSASQTLLSNQSSPPLVPFPLKPAAPAIQTTQGTIFPLPVLSSLYPGDFSCLIYICLHCKWTSEER